MTAPNAKVLNADIVSYVEKFGPCSFADLSVAHVGLPATPSRLESFRLRLKRLTEDGFLEATGLRENRRWRSPGIAQTAPPAQYNIMAAPIWRSEPSQPYRAGALDFTHCPSMTIGKATPFKTALDVDHG